jgi:probable DNA repair protein
VDPANASQPFSHPQKEALACLSRGGAVVTASARAARALRRSHGLAQRDAGKLAWQTPPIHDWESWLDLLWKQHLFQAEESPLLLSAIQERAIWKRIIGAQYGDSESIAMLAAAAWRLLTEYGARDECRRTWRGAATTDAEDFRGWAEAFDRGGQKKNWTSRGDLQAILAPVIRSGDLTLPAEIFLLGFDLLNPAQRRLIEAARDAGASVTEAKATAAPASGRLIFAKDPRDEISTCAWWARRTLEANPAARIAVIVQDIDGMRGEIDRTFRSILMPQSVGIESREPMPYEFSLGQPLANMPLVKAALLALRWLLEPLRQSEISWLLLSGFLGDAGCATDDLAAFDADLRRHGNLPPEILLEDFAAYKPSSAPESAQRLLRRIHEWVRLTAEVQPSRRKSVLEWLDFAEEVLRKIGWPGSRTLESIEFQALGRWEQLKNELAALSFDGSRIAYGEFVTTIVTYSNETIFSPESVDAAIQIMGPFESSGQHFDALWFLGANDRQWPPAARPHPLLPLWLQRKYGMPHAAIESDWHFHLNVTRRIAATAPECVFSYAASEGGGDARPSALLRANNQILAEQSSAEFLQHLGVPEPPPHRCETLPVEDLSPVVWPKEVNAGGADILKWQSACAFQAFAKRRLGAAELDEAERGLSPQDRGTILHKILENLWSPQNPQPLLLRGRTDLIHARAEGRIADILTHHIQHAFQSRRGGRKETPWTKQYQRAEQLRLHSLLSQWLDYEAKRQDFTVAEQEKKSNAEINGMKLSLRVDRIDEVSGGRLIIDYKTGKVSPNMWTGPRPDEPQLPLYAIHAATETPHGVLFAKIRAEKLEFVGYAEDAAETISSELKPASALIKNPLTETILGDWSDALSNLADEFLMGHAAVAPKSYPATCQHCPLPGLCRVAETAVAIESDEEDEADGDADADESGNSDE